MLRLIGFLSNNSYDQYWMLGFFPIVCTSPLYSQVGSYDILCACSDLVDGACVGFVCGVRCYYKQIIC